MLIAALFLELNCVVHNCWFIKRNNEFGWFGFFFTDLVRTCLDCFSGSGDSSVSQKGGAQNALVVGPSLQPKTQWVLYLCLVLLQRLTWTTMALLIFFMSFISSTGYIFSDILTINFFMYFLVSKCDHSVYLPSLVWICPCIFPLLFEMINWDTDHDWCAWLI